MTERGFQALGWRKNRIKARLGAPKALPATAHKLARMLYLLWRSGEPYRDPGAD